MSHKTQRKPRTKLKTGSFHDVTHHNRMQLIKRYMKLKGIPFSRKRFLEIAREKFPTLYKEILEHQKRHKRYEWWEV